MSNQNHVLTCKTVQLYSNFEKTEGLSSKSISHKKFSLTKTLLKRKQKIIAKS